MTVPTVSPNEVVIRPMMTDDVAQVVQVHLASFPGFFLTFLGPDFLTLLYGNMRCDPQGVVLVACRNEHVDGFVAGVTQQSGFYQRLIEKQKWAFAIASARAVFKNPSVAPRLARALRRPTQARAASADACLMSLAVRPEAQGNRVGGQLVVAFCEELAKLGVSAVCLDTDRDENERVNRFYRRLGFELARCVVTPEGRAMNEYVMQLLHQKSISDEAIKV